jgi:hypothetical protein
LLRLDHGVELLDLDHDKPIDTKRLVRLDSPDSLSPQHFILGRIKYPKDEGIQTGLFVYVQMSLTGDEEIDLAQFKKTNPRFPDEPIINQFYSKDQVESFRQLGEHIGKMLCWDIEEYKENTSNPNVTYTKLIDRVDLAFREAYRNECRQEHIVASDDARMGWHINGELPNIEVIKHIREYESAEHTDYQNRIKNYVAWCTDGATPPRDRREFNEVLARDIFPIAIECNRRHSGFRSEWPTSYFQINGRDTLMRVTKGFLDLLEITNDEDKNEDKRLSRHEKSVLNLTTRDEVTDKLAEIAVILQRAVFRLEGASTASDLIICLLHLWVDRESVDTLPESAMWLLINKLRSEENRVKVRKAVETGNRFEVKTVLQQIVRSVN